LARRSTKANKIRIEKDSALFVDFVCFVVKKRGRLTTKGTKKHEDKEKNCAFFENFVFFVVKN
jgi:hypothetical protein